MFSNLKEPSSLVVTVGEHNSAIRHAVDGPGNYCLEADTFDLVVDGYRGVGHPVPLQAVENSARHGKTHHAEYGLDPAQESQLLFNTVAHVEPDLSMRRRLYLQLQTVVLHFEIHPRRSDIKGDPFPPVERHLDRPG